MKTPGVGYRWPRSIQEAVRLIGSDRKAARYFGFAPDTMQNMLACRSFPVSRKNQQRFFDCGWTTYELPLPEPSNEEVAQFALQLRSYHGAPIRGVHCLSPIRPSEAAIARRIRREEPVVVALAEHFMLSGARGPAHANELAWRMIDKHGFDAAKKKLISLGMDLTWPPPLRYYGQPRNLFQDESD